MIRLALLAVVVFASLACAGPTIGFNLWDTRPHAEDPGRLVREVEVMHAAGLRRIVFLPFVYADLQTGEVKAEWPGDGFGTMSDLELKSGIQRAKQLGFTVGVTPFCEPRKRSTGRGEIAFTPATDAGKLFWNDYRREVLRLATLSKAAGVDQFNVGSELVGMDGDRANAGEWKRLIDEAAAAFGGDVGYTTQHWTFDRDSTRDMIWRHPKIAAVSLSAYIDHQPEHGHPGLATPADCLGAASDTPAFVETVTKNANAFLEQRVLKLAKAVNKPVRIGEFGIPPIDGATLKPYEWQWPAGTPADPTEAANVWRGLLAACAKHPQIQSVDAWLWDWPGGFTNETFGLRPGENQAAKAVFDVLIEKK